MGLDAQGWFDIEGSKITEEDVANLEASLKHAGFDLGDRTWFIHAPGFVHINFDLDRYYGPGYERGINFFKHATVLGWLVRNLPPKGRVFYGSDSTDREYLEEWTEEREQDYLDHYFRVGHAPYRDGFKR